MIIITVMLVAVFAFLLGFLLGFIFETKPNIKVKKVKVKAEDSGIQKEYENFLNYDGTAQ